MPDIAPRQAPLDGGVTADMRAELERIAAETGTKPADVLGSAIAGFLADDRAYWIDPDAILAAIDRGRADMRAGRFADHDDVVVGIDRWTSTLKG